MDSLAGSLMRLQSDVTWGHSHLKAGLRLEPLLSRWHTPVSWLSAGGLRSLPRGLSMGLLLFPRDMAASFSQSESSDRDRERNGSFSVFGDIPLQVAHYDFDHILLVTRVIRTQCRRKYTTRRWDSLVDFLEVGCHTTNYPCTS